MAKVSKRAKIPPRVLYLGEWLSRLDVKPVDLANAIGKGQPYISQLISRKKKNPSIGVLLAMSEFLKVPVNLLFQPPPSVEVFEKIKQLTPVQQLALQAIELDAIKN